MTCKLSRKKKKHLDKVIKNNKFYRSFFGILSANRAYKKQIQNIAKISSLLFPKKKYNYHYDFTNMMLYGNMLLKTKVDVHDINFEMYFVIPYMYSSTVKRSRVKNILVDFKTMDLNEYNEYNGSTENPVSMYFKIMSNI